MFQNLLKFFITNARMNYLLFILVFLTGVYSYTKTPKEIFPSFELDMVSISGGYTGASIDILDKMAVKRIEDEVKNIDGIKELSTIISPARFNIIVELEKRVNKYNTANKIKDAISITKQYLPDDMNEPMVKVLTTGKRLLSVAISSKTADHAKLIGSAKILKEQITNLKNISEVTIYGDAEIYYDISLNSGKIQALGIDENGIASAIRGLSYIYPIGKIEDSTGGHFYISTYNGKKTAQGLLESQMMVQGKRFYLKDIATVTKRYEDSASLFSVDTQNAIDVAIGMSDSGNALEISKEVSAIVKRLNLQNEQLTYLIHDDYSVRIKDRLNIVVSNILLGLILISFLVMVLINTRMSFVISLGIPTSFVMGAFWLYASGYSINMISLIGVLIALGIIVDDAIVVSENIQQHIEAGIEPKEAAIVGAKEMFKPVTIASLTTLFAFIPALMIGGTLGEVMKLIPITVSVLVLASLIESFVFLPIHAAHILKKESKPLDWGKANRIYSLIIHYLIHFKKTFLLIFLLLVPIGIIMGIKASKFQMFPKFDSSTVTLTLKANVNSTTEETHRILKEIEEDLYAKKEQLYIEHIGAVAGWRRDSGGNSETYPYVGQIKIELQKLKAQNFIDAYITPTLSFYYDETNRIREKKSAIISVELREFLKEHNYKERFNLTDIDIVEKKVGPIKSDIKIGLISNDNAKVINYMQQLRSSLLALDGIVSVDDGMKFGIDEIKLKVNSYGESLGINEQQLGQLLSNMYLERKVAIAFDATDLLEIRIKRDNKDSIEALKNFEINLGELGTVRLKEVVEFQKVKSFEKIIKDFGEKNFYIYANVNSKIITANEAIAKIQPLLDTIKADGIKLKFKGEQEKQKSLKNDMMAASALAMILIMLSMLYLFNSFRETFMMMSVIPFSFLGVLAGHFILDINLSLSSVIGTLGLAGVVINDGIIMMINLKKATNIEEIYHHASKRFRPIILTTITTLIGLSSLIFFPTGQAVIFQPMAIALGFGLLWGTVLNLLYLPVLYVVLSKKRLIS
ncbi:efflux RND transporter permease subunit [Sulfurovum sp. bin170]|uniref:efflux RND transporter permease subunit n=1 Tax=Sulfurovum sp. bin170 TaxID=2695268 RepID=UPI0013E0D9D2|nr:efflux RND transporter permease subunit [Sulfurovum sp. bin170]NEW61411.1 efflux RND transporter permease subunit [Sulfurovum sp. bin170]